MKKPVSIILIIAMLFAVSCYPINAVNTKDLEKTDTDVEQAILNANGKPVPVAVYFTDINIDTAQEKTIEKVKGVVSQEIIDIAFNDGSVTSLSQTEANKQMNYLVKTENEIIADMNRESTQQKFDTVFRTDKPEVFSTGTYTPNVNAYLTEEQITTANNSSVVTMIRCASPGTTEKQSAPVRVSKIPYLVNAPKSLKAGAVWTIKISDGSSATWSSSNKSIATVNKGKITALSKGSTVIKAEFSTGIILKYTVRVTTSPTLQKNSVTVKKGKTTSVRITGKASSINNRYTNTSRAKIISKVNSATLKIKGYKIGTTTLKVRVNGVKTLSIKVKVKK
ncbi:MAG: Ig-like domain-containing protein [Ruminococcus sp.]